MYNVHIQPGVKDLATRTRDDSRERKQKSQHGVKHTMQIFFYT